MHVNTMPRVEDIGNGFREVIVAAHQSGKKYRSTTEIYKTASEQTTKLLEECPLNK